MNKLTCPNCWGDKIEEKKIYKLTDGIGHRPVYKLVCWNCGYKVTSPNNIKEAIKTWQMWQERK